MWQLGIEIWGGMGYAVMCGIRRGGEMRAV